MNEQETFDFVVSSIIKQGKPSRDSMGRCMYRSPDGSKCAVGFLIPDEEYSPAFEHKTVEDLMAADVLVFDHPKLLELLQQAHDDASPHGGEFIAVFKAQCKRLAQHLNLQWNF